MIKLLEEWHRGNTTAVEERLVVEEEPVERGEQPKRKEEWRRGNTAAVEERLVVEEEPVERGEQPKRKEDSWTEINSGNIKKAVQKWLQDPKSAAAKYGPIGFWDVSQVTNMDALFKDAKDFNEDIAWWTVGQVTSMQSMFHGASSFNQPLNAWNVEQVKTMTDMFAGASSFNQPLNKWNVGQVTTMQSMFDAASSFNQPLNEWNVEQVTRMGGSAHEADNRQNTGEQSVRQRPSSPSCRRLHQIHERVSSTETGGSTEIPGLRNLHEGTDRPDAPRGCEGERDDSRLAANARVASSGCACAVM